MSAGESARGGDGGVRKELGTGIKKAPQPIQPGLVGDKVMPDDLKRA